MRTRTGLCLLTCCCAVLAACTTAGPKGPDATVTKPAVGRPPAPASEGAALASEAFTAYADLGAAANDGLAPGDSYANLHTACMDDAGYGQDADSVPFEVRANRGIGFPQPYGPWGYIGLSFAEQYGFNVPDTDGPDEFNGSPGSAASLPAAAQDAVGKCFNIVQAFNNAQFATSTAVIETMNNDIGDDVINDPDLIKAQHAWTACMARNGYDTVQPDTIWQQYGFGRAQIPGSNSAPTASQNNGQIAAAVTDADCTLSTDLGGIYFAIQASYEKQFVTANQQALNAAVREFKANYARELSKLPALLRTASATPSLPGPKPRQSAHPAHSRRAANP
jgi:hypothetical protein